MLISLFIICTCSACGVECLRFNRMWRHYHLLQKPQHRFGRDYRNRSINRLDLLSHKPEYWQVLSHANAPLWRAIVCRWEISGNLLDTFSLFVANSTTFDWFLLTKNDRMYCRPLTASSCHGFQSHTLDHLPVRLWIDKEKWKKRK